MRRSLIVFTFLLSVLSSVYAQEKAPKKRKVEITGKKLVHNKDMSEAVRLILGDVKITHGNVVMFCDSAYFYNDSNRVEAYDNIHIIQNDSIHLYGDYLEYEGNTRFVKVRKNVRLIKGNVVLTTQKLDYDRNNDLAYYFDGGEIVDSGNTLTSEIGYFYANTNEAFFKDSVVAKNNKYTIFSDTLKYNTVTKITTMLGPTFVVSDDNIIYCEDGYYDTENDIAVLRNNSYVEGKTSTIKGDTIYYDRKRRFGEVFGHMQLIDTVNKIVIKGGYGFYNELTKRAFASKKPTLMQEYHGDTLYLHADTLRLDPVRDTVRNEDSRLIRAYHHVKFFRADFQGRCDSMIYDFRDSVNIFYHDPVLWAMGNQMTAQFIKLYSKNNVVYKAELENGAFIVSPEDTLYYNQLKGKRMTGYIKDNILYRIDVEGNAQTIYYPKDQELIIGANKAESSNMTIYLEEGRIKDILMRNSPKGNLKPPIFLSEEDAKLSGFRWLDDYRPKNIQDIYIHDELPKDEETTNIYEGFKIEEIKTEAPKDADMDQ
jgi:lipopolysaccharide export system protein LptA